MGRIITLLTDFGLKDPWAGAMKGVLLSINPGANVVDISHLVSPHNIAEGSFILSQAYPFFPKGTIHVAVVDPGVGGKRRPVLIEAGRHFFIGPDNGIFTPVLENERVKRVIHITNRKYFLREVSSTFHGRDVFAPCAAHLSRGVPPLYFGRPVENPVSLNLDRPGKKPLSITGTVLYVDSFGNLITSISKRDISGLLKKGRVEIRIKGRRVGGLKSSYSEGEGAPFALVGSGGQVEIACRQKRAADVIGASCGDKVEARAVI